MQNQPQNTGLSVRKSALIGTAVAIPFSVAAFYFGFVSNRLPQAPPAVDASQTASAPSLPAAQKDLKIKGNKNSKIYHLPGCPNYNDISAGNTVWFKSHEEAKAAGYRMAKNC